TSGPDGTLWFTETEAATIGRITPQGTIVEFPLPDPESRPTGIVAGPDGNLWFTDTLPDIMRGRQQARIGRITPTGTITTFDTDGSLAPLIAHRKTHRLTT